MIIAIAFGCFAIGFLAAVAVASNPRKSRGDVVGLWNGLRLVRNDASRNIGNNNGEQLLPATVDQKVSEQDGGLLTKYALHMR